MSFLDDMANVIIKSRLVIPHKDLPAVAADTANYTADGEPLTVEQMQAADMAVIDYVLKRIAKQVNPSHNK